MRKMLLAATAIVPLALLAPTPLLAQSGAALTGQVTSAEEGAMEGVLVSAKKEGSTMTITVVSDDKGNFSFPANKLDAGKYNISIRAIGYDLQGPRTAEVTAGQPAKADVKPAPEVTFKDLDGKDAALSQYKGKVVLVNFWATWCDPCFVEIPWLIELQQKYEAKGFTVLGISMDEEGKAAVAPFLAKERFNVNGQKLPMNYPIVIGNDDVADKFGGLLGYPTSFLISRDGKIVKKVQGLISYEEFTKAIEAQL